MQVADFFAFSVAFLHFFNCLSCGKTFSLVAKARYNPYKFPFLVYWLELRAVNAELALGHRPQAPFWLSTSQLCF